MPFPPVVHRELEAWSLFPAELTLIAVPLRPRSEAGPDAIVTARCGRAWRLRIDLALPAALAPSKALGG